MNVAPGMAPPTPKPTPQRELNHAELRELDELLAAAPEALEALDIVMLEGYLCGVLVQPVLLDAAQWLPPIFDINGEAQLESGDPHWRQRCTALILRYHAALNYQLVDRGWFDPLVFEDDEELEAAQADGDPPAPTSAPTSQPTSRPQFVPLWHWVVGFQFAALRFPALAECADEEVDLALERVFRHLPPEAEEERSQLALIDAEHPLATLDEAIEDLVTNIVALFDLTQEARYRVEPVKRDAAKVGRNDPCSCGSGRKFKQCHGARASG